MTSGTLTAPSNLTTILIGPNLGVDVKPLVSRPLTVEWDAPPDAVAASIRRAIVDRRYEDAGHPEWALWLVRGSVDGRDVNLRLDTHSQPGSLHAYPAGFDLRGELVARGAGTTLVARAAWLGGRWERPLVIGLGAMFALQMLLLLDGPLGILAGVAIGLASIGFLWGMLALVGRSYFSALPQVEAVLQVVGAESE